ncbi:MAG: hypothetical protein PF495_05600 [Spirochaetales bacterium]|nr:hypothetical protein [Spirochaetales bacterium]
MAKLPADKRPEMAKPLTPRLEVYWGWFMELHIHRQYHESGPQPISHTDMRHFIHDCPDMSASLVPKFKLIVSSLDVTYLNFYYEKNK